MKTIIALTLLTISTTSFATSYWFDYCHEEDIVLEYAKKSNPELLFDGECTALGTLGQPTVVGGKNVEICNTKVTKVSFLKNKAVFAVTVLDPDSDQLLNYKVIMKQNRFGRGSMCKLKSIKRVN